VSKFEVVSQFWEFTRANKKYWMIPIIVVLLVVGVLLVIAKGSVLAPFIYALF